MWMRSPSNRKMPLNTASQRRSALAAMVSNTGCTSVGELLITRRISLVAVCCSSASCVAWNSRTFSIAMAACVAKVSTSADLVGREESGLSAPEKDGAIHVVLVDQRNGEHRTKRVRDRVFAGSRIFGVDERDDVSIVNGPAFQHGAATE